MASRLDRRRIVDAMAAARNLDNYAVRLHALACARTSVAPVRLEHRAICRRQQRCRAVYLFEVLAGLEGFVLRLRRSDVRKGCAFSVSKFIDRATPALSSAYEVT